MCLQFRWWTTFACVWVFADLWFSSIFLLFHEREPLHLCPQGCFICFRRKKTSQISLCQIRPRREKWQTPIPHMSCFTKIFWIQELKNLGYSINVYKHLLENLQVALNVTFPRTVCFGLLSRGDSVLSDDKKPALLGLLELLLLLSSIVSAQILCAIVVKSCSHISERHWG